MGLKLISHREDAHTIERASHGRLGIEAEGDGYLDEDEND